MSEAAFLAALTSDPADQTTPLVYADWLDEQGDAGRAAFLRLQARVVQATRRDNTFRARCKRLQTMGEKLDRRWLAIVSRPSLAGTCWWTMPRSATDEYVFRYLAG